jgi:hypothetical protein
LRLEPLVNLRPGDYYVAAIPDAASVTWKQRPVLDVLSATATRVTLTAGQSPTVNLRTAAIR